MERVERGRPIAVIRAAILAFVMGAASTLDAQTPRPLAAEAWVDAYFAEYHAMSVAPTGPAMERWLVRYAPFVYFEDPTLGQRAMGRDTVRTTYVSGFTGPLGPVRWNLTHRITSADWVATEGSLEGTLRNVPFRVRFSTWLKIVGGRIVHQVDYVDYAAMRRQAAGTEPVPQRAPNAAPQRKRGDSVESLRVAREFYRRYEALAESESESVSTDRIGRFMDLLTDDFTIEDPTAQLHIEGRDRYRALLAGLIAKGEHGVFHWEIDRHLTDGEWVAVEGNWRGIYKARPFSTRFTTWLRIRGDRVAHQIDYLDYPTFRQQTR